MAFSHVPVALKMILQSGSIGKAAPSYGELCRFESGLCNRAPYTNTVRWPGFQPGDTGSSPVGVIWLALVVKHFFSRDCFCGRNTLTVKKISFYVSKYFNMLRNTKNLFSGPLN